MAAVLAWVSPVVLLIIPLKSVPPTGAPAQNQIAAFHYTKPAGFDAAEAAQISVYAVKPIPPPLTNAPMLMTPDGKSFAYCPVDASRLGTIYVLDLGTLERTVSFHLPSTPTTLAWSPDHHKLLYTTNDGRIGVAYLDGRIADLPWPKGQDLPHGRPVWWDDQEVAFFPPDERDLVLSLDTLRLSPIEDSPKYKAANAKDIDHWKHLRGLELPRTGSSQMIITTTIRLVQPPGRKLPYGEWGYNIAFALGFRDPAKPIKKLLPGLTIDPGDQLLLAPDGSVLIHMTSRGTDVIYFTLRDNPTPQISVASPLFSPSATEEAHSLVSDHRLCAFAYAPLINPLNGKTIGPDRQHVRATFCVSEVLADTLELWETEQYEKLRPGDVLADLHTHKGGEAVMAKNVSDSNWWATITDHTTHSDGGIPPRSAVNTNGAEWVATLNQEPYCLRFVSIAPATATAMPFPQQSTPRQANPQSFASQSPSDSSIPASQIQDIVAFVIAHHNKVSAADIEHIVSDYDDYGSIKGKDFTRQSLRLNESEYHKIWDRVYESPFGAISVNPDGVLYKVNYTITFETQSSTKHLWVKGQSDITLKLKLSAGSYLITEEFAHIHDRTEGKLPASGN